MKTTIDMAREAGFMGKDDSCGMYAQSEFDGEICWEEYAIGEKIRRFEALVRADQREIDAKICESLFDLEDDTCNEAEICAAAIRARGNT
jgi:hypothetical protein